MSSEWLTPDEQRAWRTYLRMSALLPAHLGRQLQRDSGLSLPEYEVLVQLSEADGHRLRPYQLCKALSWEQSRLSHQLSRMERRGLVAREGCQDDGRGAFVILREAGATAIESAAPGHVATVREAIFGRLTDDERACFEKTCAAILGALAEHDQELLSVAIAVAPADALRAALGVAMLGAAGVLGMAPGPVPGRPESPLSPGPPWPLPFWPLPFWLLPFRRLPSLPVLPLPWSCTPVLPLPPGCGKYGGYEGSFAYSLGNCPARGDGSVQTW